MTAIEDMGIKQPLLIQEIKRYLLQLQFPSHEQRRGTDYTFHATGSNFGFELIS